MNEVTEKEASQDQDRRNAGKTSVQVYLRLCGAVLLLLAAGWITLASTSHLRQSKLDITPAPAPLRSIGADVDQRARATSALAALPLMFEPNVGQAGPEVKFLAHGISSHGLGYGVSLLADGATLSVAGDREKNAGRSVGDKRIGVLRMKLVGANSQASPKGDSPLPGKSNYFIGDDPSRWHRDVPQFSRVRYASIYPGIDLVFYGNRGRMEYDFQVAPGADPAQAELRFEGAKRIEVKDGNLLLHAEGGAIRLEAPRVYQRVGEREQAVEGRFEMRAGNRVGFAIGSYDRSRELVIDPVLNYSTYFGGSGDERATSIAVDGGGNIYLTGSTTSPNLPVSASPVQATLRGAQNVYVLKIVQGTSIGYLTYLGGTGSDTPAGIAVNGVGGAYVAGTTSSVDFPTTPTNAYQAVPQTGSTGTSHAFVTALDSTGSTLAYSSYLSGNGTDVASGMTADGSGNVYVTGTTSSTDSGSSNDQFPASFPPETPAFQSTSRAPLQFFVTKVNTGAFGIGSILYSTYFGGGTPSNGVAVGGGIAVDSSKNIYFSGTTNFLFTGQSSTTDFPIVNAYQPCLDQPPPASNTLPQACTYTTTPTATDAFVAKLNPSNSGPAQLIWSTYVGGSATDSSTGIAVDSGAASVYITGTTNSTDFTTTLATGYQICLDTKTNPSTGLVGCVAPASPAPTDAFVARLTNPSTGVGSLTYFSYLGGTNNDAGLAIAVDSASDALVTGWTQSADFPVFPASVLQGTLNGPQDAFFAHLNSTTVSGQNTTGAYATYLGGSGTDEGTSIAVDASLNAYVAGDTNSTDFQTQSPLQSTNGGGFDAFATRFGTEADLGVSGTITLPNGYVSAGNQATFTYTVSNSGPDLATQVTFSDDISTTTTGGVPLTFVSATAGSGSCSSTTPNATVVCTIASLPAGSTSTVTVVVTPTSTAAGSAGTFNGGNVSVFTAGNNDPNPLNNSTTVNAKVSDYSVAITPSNLSIPAAGSTGVYTITLSPLNPYSSAIALSCCTNLPTGTKGTFSISSITLSGAAPQSSQLSISTTARPISTTTASTGRGLWRFYAVWLSLPGMAIVGIGWKSGRRRKMAAGVLTCLLFGAVALQPACSSKSVATPVSGTPSGTYTLVATATSGSDSKSLTFTLTVP